MMMLERNSEVGMKDMKVKLDIVVHGAVPADLAERISMIHASAILESGNRTTSMHMPGKAKEPLVKGTPRDEESLKSLASATG